MLPRLERLLDTRVDAQGTLMALEVAATCIFGACCDVTGLLCDEMHRPSSEISTLSSVNAATPA